ncbi:hypothetical protein PYW07_012684 [Mythimna separata]|uniref:HTH psq-type domain-containing protein n=1 Tax=Mythimna separata TaxID=271217 RepID=A0AAD7Y8U0_MYTSE|nr:hypothetical protein PYW07_012684 [Mythimna separata]
MPRIRKRKTTRAQCSLNQYEDAYKETKRGTSLRQAAEMHDVNRMSLLRYVRKRDNASTGDNANNSIGMGYVAHNKVFSEQQVYIICCKKLKCSKILFLLLGKYNLVDYYIKINKYFLQLKCFIGILEYFYLVL